MEHAVTSGVEGITNCKYKHIYRVIQNDSSDLK
jgi:hypothetical protein